VQQRVIEWPVHKGGHKRSTGVLPFGLAIAGAAGVDTWSVSSNEEFGRRFGLDLEGSPPNESRILRA
jgi:hypothetical protein